MAAQAGCLLTYDHHVNVTGAKVAEADLDTLEAGKTTREDLVRAFGKPTQSLSLEDDRELLVYVHKRNACTDTVVFLLLCSNSGDSKTVRFNFELENGVVLRHWTEEL